MPIYSNKKGRMLRISRRVISMEMRVRITTVMKKIRTTMRRA